MLALNSRGAYSQLAVATALVLVIPLLSFGFIVVSTLMEWKAYSVYVQLLICFLGLVIGLTGYMMLRRYPQNIESLRGYLQDMAEGELPAEVKLQNNMDDVSAIARYLNMILLETRKRVELLEKQLTLSKEMQKTIEDQGKQLVEAERHRVMLESLGTACHHIGQPATVLRLYLESLPKEELSDISRKKLKECHSAIETIANILHRLRNLSEYRTVPYQTFHHDGLETSDRILDIEQ